MNKLPKGVITFEGVSLLDGVSPVAVITTFNSKNTKTGDMAQTWIIRTDIPPHEAVKTGDDSAVCGDCKYANGNGCYVQTWHAPLSIYKAYKRGNYKRVGVNETARMLKNKVVRIGAYGDPSAVPSFVWDGLLLGHTAGHTGYTHQWRHRPELKAYLMASVDTPTEAIEAIRLGWRLFAVHRGESIVNGKVATCPASKEAGHLKQCIDCKACNGVGPDNERSQRAHVEIEMH